jgi:hypothetical protein
VAPTYSSLLWWPDGIALWLQSWDLPSAVVVLPFWGLVPDVALYNLAIVLSFSLSGWTFYLLAREMFGGSLAPFLAGCVYTFSTYHFAHSMATLHIASMQWSPIYFLGLVRTIRNSDLKGPVMGGIGLTLATLASLYHLVFCLIATAVLVSSRSLGPSERLDTGAPGLKTRVALLVTTFALLGGWLLVGMGMSYWSEPYWGSHDPTHFSADLQSLVAPNAVSLLSTLSGVSKTWIGPEWSSGAYVGYVGIGLSVYAATRSRSARGFVWLAATGAALSLGPVLHIGGVMRHGVPMPFDLLLRVAPVLGFSGLPSRFAWLITFGVALGAGAGFSRLCQRGRQLVAITLTAVALVEVWPHAFTMSDMPTPPILTEWSREPTKWAVLDASGWSRALRNQMIHKHAIVGGYATRIPRRLVRALMQDDVLRAFMAPLLMLSNTELAIPPVRARERLRQLTIRFVIVDDSNTALPVRVGLAERYTGGGLVIYEVPPG